VCLEQYLDFWPAILSFIPKITFYLPSSKGRSKRKVNAGYFIFSYFFAELIYAIVSIVDPFIMGQTAHFAHIGVFIAGAKIAGIFRAIKGTSYLKKNLK
jgi:membrane associated rhomboid family serine protease